ncbi:MAG: hypothetical protein KDB55_05210 [Mycobacterium sp.]|nr:hypothetical protein [Mycobacterium sp.]
MTDDVDPLPVDPITDALAELRYVSDLLYTAVLVMRRDNASLDAPMMTLEQQEELVGRLDWIYDALIFGLAMVEK